MSLVERRSTLGSPEDRTDTEYADSCQQRNGHNDQPKTKE